MKINIKNIYLLSSLLFLQPLVGKGNQDSVLISQLQPQFETIVISKNKVIVPKIKNYDVELIGSNNQAVIDLKGRVQQPLVDKEVKLLFKVSSKKNKDTQVEIPSQAVSVGGKHATRTGNAQPFVIPSLREWVGGQGHFQLREGSRIIYLDSSATAKDAAELLQEDIRKLIGKNLPIVSSKGATAGQGDILIGHSNDHFLGKDGYHIAIGDVFTISAPHYPGKVFGTRTLLQLLDQDKIHYRIPQGEVRDYPSYEVRGFMLDVARKFFTIDFLNDYVELMSYYKMSDFQIHLNDNGFKQYFDNDWNKTYAAFRLENERYPDLTAKDGSYSKKEFIDLQKKALRYGITIIPEIDVPAHSLAFAHAIPEIGSDKYGMDHLDLHHPKTYEVVKNVFDEYTKGNNPVFIGQEVHVGTDEYDKAEAEKFRAFTDFVFKAVQDNGKHVRAWGALTHAQGTTPVRVKNVTLNSWYNGYGDPIEMKKLGYPQISTPDGFLYIVPFAGYYYDYLNTDFLYNSWTPRRIGNVTFEEGDPIVRGGMFAVWNDIVGNGISEKDVHNRVFPAVQVLAQKMWGGDDDKPKLYEFNRKKASVIEAPGLNLRGAYGHYPTGLIYELSFDNDYDNSADTDLASANAQGLTFADDQRKAVQFAGDSQLQLPIAEIGESYTVSFWIKASEVLNGDLFRSANASVFYGEDGLGYKRDGYTYLVDYTLPTDTWSLVTITGDKTSTQFYLNDKLVKDMKPAEIVLETKDRSGKEVKFNKIQTLVFPLETVQLPQSSLADLRIYNHKWNAAEVADEFRSTK